MDLLMSFIRWEDQISASDKMKTHLILPHLTDLFFKFFNFRCRSREGWWPGLTKLSFCILGARGDTREHIGNGLDTRSARLKNTHNVRTRVPTSSHVKIQHQLTETEQRKSVGSSWHRSVLSNWTWKVFSRRQVLYLCWVSAARVYFVSCFTKARGMI